jgi:hypothetical protein
MFYGFGASPIVVDGIVDPAGRSGHGSYLLGVDAKTGKQRYKVDRPGVISGYSDADRSTAEGRRQADPRARVVPALGLRREGRPPVWWVRGLACEMKSVVSIDGDTGVDQRLGLLAEPAGHADPTISWEEGLKVYDKNKDGWSPTTKSPADPRRSTRCSARSTASRRSTAIATAS